MAVFSGNYVLYGDMSQRVMTVLQQYAPNVEIYSIDEAFPRRIVRYWLKRNHQMIAFAAGSLGPAVESFLLKRVAQQERRLCHEERLDVFARVKIENHQRTPLIGNAMHKPVGGNSVRFGRPAGINACAAAHSWHMWPPLLFGSIGRIVFR